MPFEKISKPGVYDGVPEERYHADLCIGPSLGNSGAKLLVDACPAVFWWGSYLNPDREPDDTKVKDFGKAAHLIVLQPERRKKLVEIKANDFRTKAAQEQRDVAYSEDRIPLLTKDVVHVDAMVEAVQKHPLAKDAFVGGQPEQTIAAVLKSGVWIKARPDFRADGGELLIDYKTVPTVEPRALDRHAFEQGWYQQGAWYMDTNELATGIKVKQYLFVCQEREPPYLLAVCLLTADLIQWGRKKNRKAIDVFERCIKRNEWPGYRPANSPDQDSAFPLTIPNYGLWQLEARDAEGDFRTSADRATADDLRRGERAQAPLHNNA